ncbi:hypothetical protein GR925_01385 [Streptomyces sp. HUCO-GS316]|uniref:hypothetical protein n=1 Tax=Streptomyces sp. HUCO-GS316 TaxID=2692198 RepID=UPI00136C8780|nr:hypothetical protein [Streptomyces sp. HUCO-GS316]MXM62137.1 hypothetical protein [Streptomyces sp. HUCO-GS316]
MGRRLAAAVHLRHPVTHEPLVLQPGEEPDEDLAAAITNPDCWGPDEESDDEESEGAAGTETTQNPPEREREREREPEPAKPARRRAPRKTDADA